MFRKVEIASGVAVILSALIQFVYFFFNLVGDFGNPTPKSLILGFMYLVFPALVVLIGAYVHAVKGKLLGLGIVVVSGIVCFFSYGYVFLLTWYGKELSTGLIPDFVVTVLPPLSYIVTITSALCAEIFAKKNLI